jgi:hypothetical protein
VSCRIVKVKLRSPGSERAPNKPVTPPQLRQGLLPRKRCHRHSRLKFRAVLLPLYARTT